MHFICIISAANSLYRGSYQLAFFIAPDRRSPSRGSGAKLPLIEVRIDLHTRQNRSPHLESHRNVGDPPREEKPIVHLMIVKPVLENDRAIRMTNQSVNRPNRRFLRVNPQANHQRFRHVQKEISERLVPTAAVANLHRTPPSRFPAAWSVSGS